ncbi:MAG: SDR family oxidoreductase [Actinomycetota bacterium]|nr:SDR family oxidoreductase [Actinomycetota bacterium]
MSDKVIIVTGAARGIGLAVARVLADDGASVVITDVTDAEDVAARELGGKGTFMRQDVGRADDWKRVTDLVMNKYGRLDGLVNNAGVAMPATVLDTDQDTWDRHYRVNQLGTFLGMKAAAGIMKDTGGGSIVNVGSMAGQSINPGMFPYSTTKWAVRAMSNLAAAELGPYGIRVNSVYPGAIQTDMMGTGPGSEEYMNAIPLGRPGQPSEIADVIRFLLSDESSYMSGAELKIAGGM